MIKDPERERELDRLRAELARRRAEWIPQVAPNVRASKSPRGWRLGDISGAPGESLLIYADPEHRTHIDYNGKQWTGDDLDLIRDLCQLPDFPSTVERAAGLIGFRLEARTKLRNAKAAKNREPSTTVFEYRDASGAVRFEVAREDLADGTKRFHQRRRDAAGRIVYNLDGVETIPYRLPELLEGIKSGATIFIAEGERKVGLLARWGLVATCNPAGAGKWRAEFAEFFKSRQVPVVILPDHDAPGREHARQIAENLHAVAESIRIVDLPRLGPKEDVLDWAEAGGTKRMLLALVETTPEWSPEPATPEVDYQKKAAGAEGGDAARAAPEEGPGAPPREDQQAPGFTEEALALDFAVRHAAELRYVAFWSRWLIWDDRRWHDEETLRAFDLARAICRQAAIRCNRPKIRSILASAKTVAAVERLAKADRRLAAMTDKWDRDPWLLNMEVEHGNG